ncbi:hypothetical protein ACFX1T_035772 [Malus domestica]
MITFSKIEETLLFESQESDSQQDCFLKIEKALFSKSRKPNPRQDCLFKNRRGTVLRTSRVRFPWIKLVCNLHTQHQLSKYHRPFFQSVLTKLKHVKLAAPTTLL